MSVLAEGIWPCTVQSATFGERDGIPQVQINVRIDDGPSKGRSCTYEDQVNARSALYVGRSCRAVGWRGKDLETLKGDVEAFINATGGKSTVEVKHIELTKGKKFDKWLTDGRKGSPPIWDKVNGIGRGPKPLAAASAVGAADANDAMRAAMEADGFEPPADDVPHAAESTDDIPF